MVKSSGKKTEPLKRLVLLDAHALLHRAYHALPEFANSKGIPTGGLFGFTSMIFKIVSEFHPDYIVACYDLPQPTFRHEAYDAYKGKRAKTDDALKIQIDESRRICAALCIPIYDLPGFEADDMLGTIVEITKHDKNLEILIATGDMDSLQLVDHDRVRVFTQKRGMNDTVVYNESAVNDRFGFGPKFLTDYKGLRGDPSDNIIGVPGIGEKTATELILKFGTLEDLFETIHKDRNLLVKQGIKERIVKLLEDNEENAIFSKTLATIRRDAPIDFHLPEHRWIDECRIENVEPLLREFEFKTLATRLRDLLADAHTAPSSAQNNGADATPPTPGGDSAPSEQLELSPRIKIALWLLNSDLLAPTQDDLEMYVREENISDADASLTREIHEQNLDFVFNTIELPLVPVLATMQSHGILIDADYLKNLSVTLHEQLKISEAKIYGHVGHEFNINSPKQLGEVLFGEMNIHASVKGFKVKKTASGTYSTRESDLEKLADLLPDDQGQIIKDIFEYREVQKLLSTYIDNMPEMLDGGSRIHPELVQTGAATGRFSSRNPNIQNIPIKSEIGKKIRNAFIAPPGFSIVAADYSQIELRSAAILSGDPAFIETFRSGRDVHASVASRVFHVPENEVTATMRRQAKVINFGILFGMGVTALQKNLGTNRADAQKFYDEYFQALPKLSEYIDTTIATAKKIGYTQTLFGRRRHFPALRSPIPYIRAMAERATSNAPIQGTTADIIKLAMIAVQKKIESEGLQDKMFMTMQIHDELVFEVADDIVPQAKKLIKETMESILDTVPMEIPNKVPLDVSVESGKSWGEAKE